MSNERLVQLPDGAYVRGVAMVDPATGEPLSSLGSPPTPDRELVVSTYQVKTAFSGAAVGDTITATQVIDVSGAAPSTLSTVWRNQSAGVDLVAPPASANLELMGGQMLTAAQLQAIGLATAANQVTQIGYLADLADTNDRHATYKLVQSEDLGAGTKYILKSNGTGWLMIRKTYTDTASTMAYAGPANNSGVTLASAWGDRATLTYADTVGGV